MMFSWGYEKGKMRSPAFLAAYLCNHRLGKEDNNNFKTPDSLSHRKVIWIQDIPDLQNLCHNFVSCIHSLPIFHLHQSLYSAIDLKPQPVTREELSYLLGVTISCEP